MLGARIQSFISLWLLVFDISSVLGGIIYKKVMPSSEKRLIKQLVDNYENAGKIGRPVKNMKETITVGYGLTLFQLLDLDEKNQVLTTNVWAKYTWIDQLLRWDPSNYTDIQEVRIPPRLIWTPDIVLYNFNDERLQELRDVMLNVDFTGQIFWSPPAIFKSNCHIDIRNFPFDNQYCFLKFASWTHDSEQLDLQFFDNVTEVDVGQYTENNEWILIARPARRFVMMSENCGKKIPDLTFFLFLQRNPAFYAYLLVFPCILLSLLTTVAFWLPPHVPAKTLLSMNIFVAFSLLLKILATSTPSASTYVPYLGYYYCFNMTLLSLSTFLSTMVINLHAFGTKGYCVPEWLTELVSAMALPLGITKPQGLDVAEDTLSVIEARLREKKYRYMFSPPGNQERHYCHPKSTQGVLDCLRLEPNTASIQVGNGNPPPFQDNPCQSFEQMKCNHKYLEKVSPGTAHCPASRYPPNIVLRWSQDSTPQAGDDLPPYSNKKAMKQEKKKLVDQLRRHSSGNRKTLGVQTSMRALKEALKNLMTKIDKKEKAARRERDWHLVAMTMDRICFWFYVLMIIGAGFYLLFPRGPIHTVEETIEMHKEFYERRNAEIATQCLLRHDVRIQIGS